MHCMFCFNSFITTIDEISEVHVSRHACLVLLEAEVYWHIYSTSLIFKKQTMLTSNNHIFNFNFVINLMLVDFISTLFLDMTERAKNLTATNTTFFLFLRLEAVKSLGLGNIQETWCVPLPLERWKEVPQQCRTGHHGPKVLWSAIKTENIIFPLLFHLLNVNSFTTRWRGVLCFWHLTEILSQQHHEDEDGFLQVWHIIHSTCKSCGEKLQLADSAERTPFLTRQR